MGKLFGSRTYLVGAMDRVKDQGAGWRDRIIPKLHDLGVIVYNPLNKPLDETDALEDDNNRKMRAEWKERGEWHKFKASKIRGTDLRMVDLSDFIIANIDTDVHACGTYEEITTANRQKKPILVHCEQGKKGCPDWLLFMLPHVHVYDTWGGLISGLVNIDCGGYDPTGRWILFDLAEEMRIINGQ